MVGCTAKSIAGATIRDPIHEARHEEAENTLVEMENKRS